MEQGGLADRAGFTATVTSTHVPTVQIPSQVRYDLLGEVSAKTQLTRRTVASILRQMSPATFAQYRRNPAQFITESARLINEQIRQVMVVAAAGPPR